MKTKWLTLIIILNIILYACDSKPQITETPVDAPQFKVALLLPRAIDADGWTQAGYAGLLLIESELHAAITYRESIAEDQFEQAYREYAEAGYDFIIGHGAQFVAAAEAVAVDFPHAQFVVVGLYEGNNRNLGALSFRGSELGYLAGALAATKSQSNRVALMIGEPNMSNQEVETGYIQGAKYIKPDIDVTVEYVGSWTDSERAKQVAQELIDSGYDVIATLTGQTAPTIYDLAENAGVHIIAWSSDQNELAPNTILGSAIENASMLLLEGATLARQGRWEGKQYKYGLQENALYIRFNEQLVTEDEVKLIEAIRRDIIAGIINTLP